ncbi:hypothetical protein NL676_017280 [Syzygium grande]|nr:hypothetical protein NL676_017280 [Syzygium grande]
MVNTEAGGATTSRMGGHRVRGHMDGTGRSCRWSRRPTSVGEGEGGEGVVGVRGALVVHCRQRDELDDGGRVRWGGLLQFHLWWAYLQQKMVIPIKRVGQKVKLEVDILGKYVERLLRSRLVDSMKTS